MNYSVLVADDEEDDSMLLDHHLKTCHQTVTLTKARNGIEATEYLRAGLPPNLITLDANRPLINGYELADKWV